MYSKLLNINEETLMKKFWGDYFFDPETKKIVTEPTGKDGKPLQRTFVKFIIDPILKMCRAIMLNDKETYEDLMQKVKVELNAEERKKLTEKDLLKCVMSRWLSAADCLMEMMIMHLPSPKQAQKYRADYLYEGPTDDEVCESMRNCDPKGPLMVYISKMIPLDNSRFAAFGRIFSGTIGSGQKIKIMGANYKHGYNNDMFVKSVSQVGVYMMGRIPEYVTDVPCGNIVAIVGIDEHLIKTGTLGSIDIADSHPIKSMKYSVSPVYKVAVRCKNPADLPKLEKGLNRLSKSDPLIKIEKEETGEITVAGSGELHIEICLNDLRELSQCEIVVSEPSVTYQETITQDCGEKLLTKSANKHNRFFGTTQKLEDELIQMIEAGDLSERMDAKERTKILVEQFNWDKGDTLKIWSFGPENIGANLLVDQVKQAQYMNEVKDSVCNAFLSATKCGVLAEENLRGVRFNIVDSALHTDSVHRNAPQIIPCSRRLFSGLELASSPTLLEPIFMVEITAPASVLGGVYQTINQRRGQIVDEIKQEGSPLHVVKAYLPVAESFGLSSTLRSNTQGRAFPQCFFDHWEKIAGMPYEDPKADDIVREIRKRKGLKLDLPVLQDFIDKL